MELLMAIAGISAALLAGWFLGKTHGSSISRATLLSEKEKATVLQHQIEMQRNQLQTEQRRAELLSNRLNDELTQLRNQREDLKIQLTRKESAVEVLEKRMVEQRVEIDSLQQKFAREFENLANKILEEKTSKFTEQNRLQLNHLLQPLNEKIQVFEKRVEDTHRESISHHASLREYISGLQQLNVRISQETLNLTKALKGDTKMQGNWGELVLERVLEKSGLEKNREYYVQQSYTNAGGQRVMPDVIIHLPDGKKMVVDSKVSLVAYEKYVNEEDEVLQNAHLRDHLGSIKRHVEQLSAKNYADVFKNESPDFVLLFIPIEPAFALASGLEPELYSRAFERNVVIVTPSTLLATLRTIDSMWTNQKQQENAYEIARQAGALYDKFEGFVSDLIRIGKKIEESQNEYSAAMSKLSEGRGNLVASVERLKQMGAKAKKSLPEKVLARALDPSEELSDS